MAARWVAFMLATGRPIADFSTMGLPQSPLRSSIGQYDTAQISMYLDGAPVNWLQATRPGAAALACYDPDDTDQAIQWGGFVVSRNRQLRSGTVDLNLATMDAYFDRRVVGNSSYSKTGQNDIIRDLVAKFGADTGRYPGTPFMYECEDGAGVPGVARDRAYLDADNATLYNRLQQLAGVDGGVEWCVDLVWDGGLIRPLLRYGAHIGTVPTNGHRPNAVFDDGTILDVGYSESYADGDGANVVTAYSSGQGDVAPTSGPYTAPYNLRPAFEYRYQPSSSISNVSVLKSYAAQAVKFLAEGQNALTVTSQSTDRTRYGSLWRKGDEVEVYLESSPQFPGGLDLTARAIAYEFDPGAQTITPILATDQVPSGDDPTS